MEKIRQWTPMDGLARSVITHDAQPTRMSRSGGKGPRGNGNALPPNRAEYGLGLGKDVVRMSKQVGSGPSGSTFKLQADGPGRSGRSPKASITHQGRDYGVAGVSGSGGGGYGIGGI